MVAVTAMEGRTFSVASDPTVGLESTMEALTAAVATIVVS